MKGQNITSPDTRILRPVKALTPGPIGALRKMQNGRVLYCVWCVIGNITKIITPNSILLRYFVARSSLHCCYCYTIRPYVMRKCCKYIPDLIHNDVRVCIKIHLNWDRMLAFIRQAT